MTAYGTAAAIAGALGGKKSKALQSFARSLQPKVSAAPTTMDKPDMGVLRQRINHLVEQGEL